MANDCHNPVAEVDIDSTKRAIGDLGSWLGSSLLFGPLTIGDLLELK